MHTVAHVIPDTVDRIALLTLMNASHRLAEMASIFTLPSLLGRIVTIFFNHARGGQLPTSLLKRAVFCLLLQRYLSSVPFTSVREDFFPTKFC